MNSPVSKIALGTAQFGLKYGVNNHAGQPSTTLSHEILKNCLAEDLVSLDTAEAYGTSQDVLGQYIKAHPKAERFAIHTKFKVSGDSFDVEDNLRKSLDTLGVSSVECYYFHDFNDFLKCDFFAEINLLKKTALIKKTGVSVYTPQEALTALRNQEIDQIQIPYNILDNYSRWGTVLTEAQRLKKTVHSRSVFLQGLLFKTEQELRKDVPYLKDLFPTIQKLQEIARREDLSIEQLCLFYSLQTSEIEKVIIGLETPQQLHKNLEVIRGFRPLSLYEEISSLQIEDENLINPAKWPQLKEKI